MSFCNLIKLVFRPVIQHPKQIEPTQHAETLHKCLSLFFKSFQSQGRYVEKIARNNRTTCVFGVAPSPPCAFFTVRFMKGRSEWPDSCSQDMFLGCSLGKREGDGIHTWAHLFVPCSTYSKIIVSAEYSEEPQLDAAFFTLHLLVVWLFFLSFRHICQEPA